MTFRFGQRIRTTVDAGGFITPSVPAGSFGTVIYPLDDAGDIGVLMDGDSTSATHAYGADEVTVIADAPAWLHL